MDAVKEKVLAQNLATLTRDMGLATLKCNICGLPLLFANGEKVWLAGDVCFPCATMWEIVYDRPYWRDLHSKWEQEQGRKKAMLENS